MENESESFCGFASGQDWLDDLAVESYLLNKVEIPKSKEGAS
jgi:hypothetical protein